MMRVGVLASGEGTNLQALLDRVHGDAAEIVAVGSDHASARALERARSAGVPTRAFEAAAYPDRAARDAAIAGWLDRAGVELVVLAGYMSLLDAAFIARFPERIVNVHPSLLPAFPGLQAIEQALAYGVKVAGVTVHFVDEGVDTGAIIGQRALALDAPIDAAQLRERLRPLEHELLVKAVRAIAAGEVRRDPVRPRWVSLAAR